MFNLLPSTHVAPTSSKSLRASNFKSEPTEIHLQNATISSVKQRENNELSIRNIYNERTESFQTDSEREKKM